MAARVAVESATIKEYVEGGEKIRVAHALHVCPSQEGREEKGKGLPRSRLISYSLS